MPNWLEIYNPKLENKKPLRLSRAEVHACAFVLKQKLRLKKDNYEHSGLLRCMNRIIAAHCISTFEQRAFYRFSEMTIDELFFVLLAEGKMKFKSKKPDDRIIQFLARNYH